MVKAVPFNSDSYLKKACQDIATWETSKRGYLARFGDFVLDPPAQLTARLVPSSVQKAAGQVVEQTLRLTAHAGKFSVDTKGISATRLKRIGKKTAVGSQLKVGDDLAKRFWTTHCGLAAAQGAATGATGLAGFVTDIPLLLSIAIRVIRTIALCYGYRDSTPAEIDYTLLVLRLASSHKTDVKAEIFPLLDELELSFKEVTQISNSGKKRGKAQFFNMQEYAKVLALELVQRRTLALVPIAGIVTSASFNAAFTNDVGKTAFMCYRRRFLRDHVFPSPDSSRSL